LNLRNFLWRYFCFCARAHVQQKQKYLLQLLHKFQTALFFLGGKKQKKNNMSAYQDHLQAGAVVGAPILPGRFLVPHDKTHNKTKTKSRSKQDLDSDSLFFQLQQRFLHKASKPHHKKNNKTLTDHHHQYMKATATATATAVPVFCQVQDQDQDDATHDPTCKCYSCCSRFMTWSPFPE